MAQLNEAVALVPAAGRGDRLGYGMPKALVPVRGVPLLLHAVRGLLDAGRVRHVVVAAPVAELDAVSALVSGLPVDVVAGGADRTASVACALRRAVEAAPGVRIVLVHDAARAFTPPEVVARVVDAVAAGARAVVPVLPVTDTVKRVDAAGVVLDTPDRSALRVVQTPQGFDLGTLLDAHASAVSATDDAGLVELLGVPVTTVAGHPNAMKVTTPHDLAVAEKVLVEGW